MEGHYEEWGPEGAGQDPSGTDSHCSLATVAKGAARTVLWERVSPLLSLLALRCQLWAGARGTDTGMWGEGEKGSWECRWEGRWELCALPCLQETSLQVSFCASCSPGGVGGPWPRRGRLGMGLPEDGEK